MRQELTQTDMTIERVMAGQSLDRSINCSLFGYRSRNIHAEALESISLLKEATEFENPVGREDPHMDLITRLNSLVANAMLLVGTIQDMHRRAQVVHCIDVLHSAISDLLNGSGNDNELAAAYHKLL